MLIYNAHYVPSGGEIVPEVMFKASSDASRADVWALAMAALPIKDKKSLTGTLRVSFVCNPDACYNEG